MRRVNWKLLSVLLVLAGGAAVGVFALHRHQLEQTAAQLRESGLRAVEEGETDTALADLGRYLALKSTDLDVRIQYVEQMEKKATTLKANTNVFMAMEQVLRQAPERADIRLRLIELGLQIERPGDARAHIEYLMQNGETRPELLTLLGQCHEALSDYDEAVERYSQAITQDPSQIEAYSRLAALYRQELNRPEEGDRLMDQAVEANADDPRAHLARGRYLKESGRARAATDDVLAALKLDPGQFKAGVLLSELVLQTRYQMLNDGEIAEAQQILDRAAEALEVNLTANPDRPETLGAYAGVLWKQGQIGRAEDLIREGLTHAPENPELLQLQAQLLIDQGRFAEVEELIGSFPSGGFWEVVAADLRTSKLVVEGRWVKAIELLHEAVTHPDATSEQQEILNLRLARCERELGNHDLALNAFRSVLKANTMSVPARLGLAEALLRTGDMVGALNEYRQLRNVRRVLPSFIRLLITHNLQLPPVLRDWTETEQAVKDYQQRSPDSVVPLLLEADLAIAQGEPDRAQDLLVRAEHRFPNEETVLIAKAQLQSQVQTPESGLRLLTDRRKAKDSVELRLACARHLLQYSESPAAALKQLADESHRFENQEEKRLLHGLASIAHEGKLPELATELWIRVAALDPQDNEVQLHVFDSLGARGDLDRLKEQVAVIEASFGADHPIVAYTQAILKTLQAEKSQGERSGFIAARRLLETVLQQRPHWHRPHTALGRISERERRQSEAIDHYLRALELGESNPVVFERLVILLNDERRFDESERLLHDYGRRAPHLLTARTLQLASVAAVQNGHESRVAELAGQAAQQEAGASGLAWLGLALSATARSSDAEQHLIQAIQLEGNDPVPYIAYIRYLMRNGESDKAQTLFQKIRRDLENADDARLLPAAFEALGDVESAIVQLRHAVKNSPRDLALQKLLAELLLRQQRYTDGLTVLKRIDALGLANRPGDQRWLQLSTAVTLAGLGGHENHEQALAILDHMESADPGNIGVKRSRAFVLASSSRKSDRTRAIELFSEIDQRARLNPSERWLLARLLDRMGNWQAADNEFQELLSGTHQKPRYLGDYVQRLLAHGEQDAAERWFARLTQIDGQSFNTLRVLLLLRIDQGRAAEAVVALQSYVKRLTDSERSRQAVSLAALADDLARNLDQSAADSRAWCDQFAEENYSQAVSESPRNLFLLVQFLARRDRTAEALKWCDRVWEEDNPELAASMSIAAVYFGQREPEYMARVRERIEASLKQHPDSLPMLVSYAELASLQGQYDQAESLYRRVLAADAENLFALNNLAWLLATRGRNLPESLDLINRAIAKAGPQPDLLDTRACVAMAMKDYEAALSDLDIVLEEQPSVTAFLHLALVHARRGDEGRFQQAMAQASRKGLDIERLHPLERMLYQEIRR